MFLSEQLSASIKLASCFLMSFFYSNFRRFWPILILGDFDLGDLGLGDFNLGNFNLGDFNLGDFDLGDFDM